MISLKNKKGAEMTIGTIIIIILALVVLVLLVLGFSTGWSNLWDKIKNLGAGGQSNVDSVVQACNIACTTQSQYEYCKLRDVRFGKDQAEKDVVVGLAKTDSAGIIKNIKCPDLIGKNLGMDACSLSCTIATGTTP